MKNQGLLLDLGQVDYEEAWGLQLKLVELRSAGRIPDILMLLEHPHVFTVGKGVQGTVPSDIQGVPVYRIERGGQWTYHGPGQVVGYPILDLGSRGRDVASFLRNIEASIIEAVGKFGLQTERREGKTGVWVQNRKLASIGAAIRNWITFHGFALNVNTDLEYFHLIEPCGMPASTMTSMKTVTGREFNMSQVKQEVRSSFQAAFQLELKPANIQAELAGLLDARIPRTV